MDQIIEISGSVISTEKDLIGAYVNAKASGRPISFAIERSKNAQRD